MTGARALLGVAALALGLMSDILPSAQARQPPVRIPEASAMHRVKLEREVSARFGLDAPVARIAAQIHQESLWRADARSPYAQGLAQFVPTTARWLPAVCPEVGEPDPWDADWSLRAIVCYNDYLLRRTRGADACQRWAFALSAYNGGEARLRRERALAEAAGADPLRWFEHVERFAARAEWALRENRAYVRRVLLVLEPAYVAAGWAGRPVCT